MLAKEIVEEPERVQRIKDMLEKQGTPMSVNGFPFKTLDGQAYICLKDKVCIYDHFELCVYLRKLIPAPIGFVFGD